jgi:hypothetical protein
MNRGGTPQPLMLRIVLLNPFLDQEIGPRIPGILKMTRCGDVGICLAMIKCSVTTDKSDMYRILQRFTEWRNFQCQHMFQRDIVRNHMESKPGITRVFFKVFISHQAWNYYRKKPRYILNAMTAMNRMFLTSLDFFANIDIGTSIEQLQ